MKKKIAILGSTGSIGESTLEVISKEKNIFDIVLLSANNNYKKLIQQAKKFNAQNVLIRNENFYLRVKKSLKGTRTKVYSGNVPIKEIIKQKLDFTMSAVVGLAGLQPTIDAIKISKNVAIANKETIICAWQILSKLLKKYKTKIIPVDSEHFSIMELTKNIKVYSGNIPLTKIIKKKLDYTMSSIVGLAGLQPTIDAIKISKKLAIANKEAIVCGWQILSKLKKKYKTEIIPVDSEHFSIMELTKNIKDEEIEEIIITASGGPFLNKPLYKLNKVKIKEAVNHPNWSMGKKISIDSATLMNKVFEVIEATKIFNFNKKKYKIIIHPQSYVHSIIRFKNGLIKMILYNADMRIPISNTLYGKKNKFIKVNNVNSEVINRMNFFKVNLKKFPAVKIIDKCLNFGHSTSIIVNASNEVLVELFLKRKIGFLDIVKTINKIFKDKEFKKYAKRKPVTVRDVMIIDNWARLKIIGLCAR